MMPSIATDADVEAYKIQLDELQRKLEEAQDTLDAIRSGDVDAVVVNNGANQHQVYTLDNADRPYRLLIEKMQEGAVTLTQDGLILYCNHAFAAMMNMPAQRIIGSSFQQFVQEDQYPEFEHLLAEIGRGEILLRSGARETVQTHISFSQLLDEESHIICGVVTDISLHKMRMKELADKNQQLQKEIAEREKTEENFRQAQKMEAVGQLTGGLAHDFNNLLTVILGNLQLLTIRSEGQQDQRLQKYIQNAMSATERGAGLTQKLLAFSRRQSLKSEVVQVNTLLPGIAMLAKQIVGINIDLLIQSVNPDSLWCCLTDAHQLESTLLNLIINARDAMPHGGVITITTSNITLDEASSAVITDAQPGKYVQVCIQDTGEGIPSAIVDRVFEPFFTTKGVGKGSGLGLSMVYGFIRQINGFIDLKSKVAEGTVVSLYLPYAEAEALSVTSTANDLQEPMLPIKTGRILAVEDDDKVLNVSKEILLEIGYSVVTATNAAEALDLIAQEPNLFDLVFSDVVMPGGMNGIELAHKIQVTYPHLPILLTSGFMTQAADQQEGMESEFQILQKPYNRSELIAAISNSLKGMAP
jgi:PAS domain S-box-containing protein